MHGPTCIFWANLITFSLQGADGINIDIEWPPAELRDALTAFTCELSALLRRTVHACNPIQALYRVISEIRLSL